MSLERLLNRLARFHALPEGFKKSLEEEAIPLSLPKNHILLEAPKISTHLFYLSNGFAMSYEFYDTEKITKNFWRSGQIIASVESFFEQTPSTEFIRLLQPSELLFISYESVMNLLNTFPEAQAICRAMLIRHHAKCRMRMHDLQRLSAAERLTKLLDAYPGIEQITPQDAIASYVGVTAQSLARIKRKLK